MYQAECGGSTHKPASYDCRFLNIYHSYSCLHSIVRLSIRKIEVIYPSTVPFCFYKIKKDSDISYHFGMIYPNPIISNFSYRHKNHSYFLLIIFLSLLFTVASADI